MNILRYLRFQLKFVGEIGASNSRCSLRKAWLRIVSLGTLWLRTTQEIMALEQGCQKKTLHVYKVDLPNDTGLSATVPSSVGTRSKEALESGLVDSRQGQNGLEEECEKDEIVNLRETSDSATKQSHNRESLGSSWVRPLDHDMQSLAILADNQSSENDTDSDGLKGRLYEQYRKLRDAKLTEDQNSKRAEREAKLRIMEETLRKRKAEMDARAVRLSKNIHSQARSLKVGSLESDSHTPKKEQVFDIEVLETNEKEQTKSSFSSMSLPVTPCTSKEVDSSLKAQTGRTAGVVPQKGATPPRSSSRPIPSVSPKVTSRSTSAGAGSLQKSVSSSRGDNPLARSVPCFANLRKENTKPSTGRPSGSARVHPKNGGTGGTPGMFDIPPLEAKGNVPTTRTNFSRNGPTKQEQRNRSAPLRKSCVSANDFKSLSTSSDDAILLPRKARKEIMADFAAQNKLRRSAVGSLQDAKPFLKKGRGIGPGTGAGVMKQKFSLAPDTTKSSDEPAQIPQVNNSDSTCQVPGEVLDGSISKEPSGSENMNIEDNSSVNFTPVNHVDVQVMQTMDSSQIDGDTELDGSTLPDDKVVEPQSDAMNVTERACHTISFPIDIKTHTSYAVALPMQSDFNLMIDLDKLVVKQGDIAVFSRHDQDRLECIQNQLDEVSASSSLRASFHENSLPVSSPVPSSPSSSMVVQHEELSPSFGAKLESPMGSPATWISSQVKDIDVTQFDKKWAAFQKPVVASQPKESAKGFKRLLKFGRKSRPSEVAAGDCISASTTSEGDDEPEEQSRFLDEVSSRGRLSERTYTDVLGNNNQLEEGSAHCLRSSIPTPPVNFKMRDDHMGGGTMLRAPRSFFSLSSFRGKGSEGRARSRDHGHG